MLRYARVFTLRHGPTFSRVFPRHSFGVLTPESWQVKVPRIFVPFQMRTSLKPSIDDLYLWSRMGYMLHACDDPTW
jgi:hypothetical protein